MPQARPVAGQIPADDNIRSPGLVSVPGRVHEAEQQVQPDDALAPAQEHGHVEMFDLIRILGTAIGAGLVWFRVWEPFPHVSPIGVAGVIFGGWPIFREAFENLRERRMTMELSMTIALLAAVGIGEFVTALIITAFVLAAEVLEGLTVGRGRRAIGDLLDLLPRSAWIVKDGAGAQPIEVHVSELRHGDRVLIRPGARIPVDGQVLSETRVWKRLRSPASLCRKISSQAAGFSLARLTKPVRSKLPWRTWAGIRHSGGSWKRSRRLNKRVRRFSVLPIGSPDTWCTLLWAAPFSHS
jgi:hypothetical protein